MAQAQQEDSIDRFPTLGVCVGCGAQIKYAPIRMPLRRPMLNPQKPGHFSIEHGPMCLPCVRGQLDILLSKINAGEMYPSQTWDQTDEGNIQIVDLLPPSFSLETPEVEEDTQEEPEVGFVRRFFRWIY